MADKSPTGESPSPVLEDAFDNDQPQKQMQSDAASINSESSSIQAGVQKALILRKAWSRTTLTIAFVSLFTTTLIITFSDFSHQLLAAYVTSDFKQHSALSAATVVGNITRICAYPIIAKLSDVFGRAEMFSFSILFQTLSFVTFATSTNIGSYFASTLLDAIGGTGFLLTQQVFLADATNLVNRALWSTLPESFTTIPALYLGTLMGESFLTHTGWRWGYGTWAIVTPIVAIPLIAIVAVLQRRARKAGFTVKSLDTVSGCTPQSPLWKKIVHLIFTEIDFVGLILLVAGLSLILIPLSLTGATNPQRWKEGSFIAMIVVGFVALVGFFVWDIKYAKKPYLPLRMANRTVMCGFAVQMFDFMGYSMFTIFFPSYLQVGAHFSAAKATRVDNSLRVAYQICAMLVAVGMKYTKNAQYWLLFGPPLVIIGQGVMIYLVNMHGSDAANEASFIAAKACSGIGRAFWQTAAQVSVQAVVPRQDVAIVTGFFNSATSFGGAIGTSIAGAIWRNTLPGKLRAYLPEDEKANTNKIVASIVVAQKYAIGSPAREAIDRGFRESQMLLAIVATAVNAPNLLIMWFMKNVDLGEESEKDEKKVQEAIRKIEDHPDEPRNTTTTSI